MGYNHVLARTSDGSVYAWGDNTYGQLGLGDTTTNIVNSNVPRQVAAGDSNLFNASASYLAGATAIAAGGYHSLALLGNSDGYVYSWGWNNRGQLGTGTVVTKENLTRRYPSQQAVYFHCNYNCSWRLSLFGCGYFLGEWEYFH